MDSGGGRYREEKIRWTWPLLTAGEAKQGAFRCSLCCNCSLSADFLFYGIKRMFYYLRWLILCRPSEFRGHSGFPQITSLGVLAKLDPLLIPQGRRRGWSLQRRCQKSTYLSSGGSLHLFLWWRVHTRSIKSKLLPPRRVWEGAGVLGGGGGLLEFCWQWWGLLLLWGREVEKRWNCNYEDLRRVNFKEHF